MNDNKKITAPTKYKQEQSMKLGNTEVTISAESVTIKAEKIILLIDGKPIYHQENHD